MKRFQAYLITPKHVCHVVWIDMNDNRCLEVVTTFKMKFKSINDLSCFINHDTSRHHLYNTAVEENTTETLGAPRLLRLAVWTQS